MFRYLDILFRPAAVGGCEPQQQDHRLWLRCARAGPLPGAGLVFLGGCGGLSVQRPRAPLQLALVDPDSGAHLGPQETCVGARADDIKWNEKLSEIIPGINVEALQQQTDQAAQA